jgi:hypothetical protein
MLRMASPIYDQHHAVQFYGDEATLFQSVAAFLGQGFLDGQPAIVIATTKHRVGIVSHLEQRMIDVTRAQRLGDLVMLDAHQTLDAFMDGDAPHRGRFEDTIGPVLERMSANLSFALDNFDHEASRKHGERAMRRLYRMFGAISATNEAILRAKTEQELYQRVCDAAVYSGKSAATVVLLAEPDHGAERLHVASESGR